MSVPGWGVGDIITIPTLAVKVYTACKDAPNNYRHTGEEVKEESLLREQEEREWVEEGRLEKERLEKKTLEKERLEFGKVEIQHREPGRKEAEDRATQGKLQLTDACHIPLPEDEGENVCVTTLATVNTTAADNNVTDSVLTSSEQTDDRRRIRSLQRREREVSPEYLVGTRERSLEREQMREVERRKEVEYVRKALCLDEIALHPKPDNRADLIDNDSDANDELLPPPPPPPNLADLLDGPDDIVELDVEDIPAVRIEKASRTGPWVAPWLIPRLIETVPTPVLGQRRGPPRVFVEGTGLVHGKRQSRPPGRSTDRTPSPTLMVPKEGCRYL